MCRKNKKYDTKFLYGDFNDYLYEIFLDNSYQYLISSNNSNAYQYSLLKRTNSYEIFISSNISKAYFLKKQQYSDCLFL